MTRALVVALVMSVAALAPAGASAQSASQTATARQLFEQGLAAARESRWEDALAAFERSLGVLERPSTLLNLAGAQAQTGRLVEAAASYRRFLEIATEREARHRQGAESALRDLEGRIAHATIEAPAARSDDRVEIDGHAIALGEPVALDPGGHEVVIVRGDEELARRAFTLEEHGSTTITIPLASRDEGDADVQPVEPVPAEPASSGGEDLTAVWIGLGVGAAVLVGVGIAVGVVVGTSQPSYYGGNLGDGMIRF